MDVRAVVHALQNLHTFPCRLGADDGDDVVVKTRVVKTPAFNLVGELWAVSWTHLACSSEVRSSLT